MYIIARLFLPVFVVIPLPKPSQTFTPIHVHVANILVSEKSAFPRKSRINQFVFFEKATKFDEISILLLTNKFVFFVSHYSFEHQSGSQSWNFIH